MVGGSCWSEEASSPTRFIPSRLSWYAAFLVKAFPLDMSQYQKLFGSTRVPCKGQDQLVSHDNARHVVVMRNGHFYTLEALQPNGEDAT